MSETIVAVLLGVGMLGFAFTAVGLIVSRNLYDQIHYLAPGSILGSLAFSAAAVLHEGFSQSGSKAILAAILLLISNPLLSHATARAGRIRRNQQVLPDEHEDVLLAEERK